jgi:hypothetical protein
MQRTLFLCGLFLALAPAAPLRAADPADPDRTKPGPYRVPAVRITNLDARSITVSTRTDKPEEMTFVIDPERTKVFVSVVQSEQANEQGRVRQRSKFEPGGPDGLEVGKDVYIGADEDVAVDIIVAPPPPKKSPGAGKKAKDKPAEKK